MVVPFGSYDVSQNLPQFYNEVCPGGGPYNVLIDSLFPSADSLYFGDTISPIQEVSVSLISGIPRPGFVHGYYLTYRSLSNAPMNGTVYLVVDDTLIYNSASVVPDLVSGDTLFWNYSNLQTLESRNITIWYQVPAEVGLLGDTLVTCANISPTSGDALPANNNTCDSTVIVGSYDPNDKQVSPCWCRANWRHLDH